MSRDQKFSVEIGLGGFTFRVSGTASRGEPAQTWGPPERCHEGSPDEIEIEKIALVVEVDGKMHEFGTFEDVFVDLGVDFAEVIEPAVWDELGAQEDDADDYDPRIPDPWENPL